MASASRRVRVLVAARGHAEHYWVESAGVSERGEIETRFARYRSESGVFDRKQAAGLARRLRKWWAVVKVEPVI
jgi:hypothetical protein